MPVAFDRGLDLLKRKLIVWSPSDGSTAELCRALTPDERSNLQARADALEGALAPHSEDDRERINSALTAMFAGFRQMRQSGDDMEATITITRAVLRDFPPWAIEQACLKIARHEIAGLDPCWPPSDAQIVEAVKATVKLRKQALDDARLVLSAIERQERVPRSGSAPRAQLPPEISPERLRAVLADCEARRLRKEQADDRQTDPPRQSESLG